MTAADREVLVMQLLAARAQIDATLAVLGVRVDTGEDVAPTCTHPPEKRQHETVMGGPERWTCVACGYQYDESKESPGDVA
jgi:transposase-like protein